MNLVFVKIVKSRLLMDFNFYKANQDLDSFQLIWSCEGVLGFIAKGQLFLTCFDVKLDV